MHSTMSKRLASTPKRGKRDTLSAAFAIFGAFFGVLQLMQTYFMSQNQRLAQQNLDTLGSMLPQFAPKEQASTVTDLFAPRSLSTFEASALNSTSVPLSPGDHADSIAMASPTNNPEVRKRYAVTTYLRGNARKYVMGAIVLLESVLPATLNGPIETVVVCHDSVSNETQALLQQLGHKVTVVHDVEFKKGSIPANRFTLMIHKYAAFNLIEYDKVLFVDSDAYITCPQNLTNVFAMLDDSYFHMVNPKPYSFMRKVGAINITDEQWRQLDASSQHNKVFMAPDFGRDSFNSGLMLYRPTATMYEDFQAFLRDTVYPMNEKQRGPVTLSTQRLLQEFLFMPGNAYKLYNFCPYTNPSQCKRAGCHCDIHVYPNTLDCKRDYDKHVWDKATMLHFSGGLLDYETLCDPNSTNEDLEKVLSNYVAKTKGKDVQMEHFDTSCHVDSIRRIRTLYQQAMKRLDDIH